MMPYSPKFLAALRAATVFVLALHGAALPLASSAASPAKAAATRGESESLLAAENALREGNCRAAAENFLAAAQVSTNLAVVKRAAQISVGCDQLSTARAAATRWRELEPYSGEAALTAAIVALKRYDLTEARENLTAWRDSGSAGSQDPLRFAELLEQEADPTAVARVFGEVLVGTDPTSEVLLAQARLELAAQNMRAAMDAAQRSLALDTDQIEAQSIVLRALSVLGEHNAAIEGARALGNDLQGEDAYLLADLLAAADRQSDATEELQRLLAIPALRLGAERRLVAMDIREGRFDEAERRLAPLLADRGTAAMALLYMAQLAERRGDDARAIQSYRLLADTSVALAARSGAARLMLKRDDKKSALALLDDYAARNPEQRIEVGATKAQLLAQAGDLPASLEILDQLQKDYPGYPDLDYQRATVLETGGKTREAVAQFERALKLRPDDPQLANALGFTLADHKQRLPQAEKLVRQAIAVSPDSAPIQDSLGWVLYRRGKLKEALPHLARAWLNSGDGEIAAHYGEVLWKSGDEGQARYVWQKALTHYPTHKSLLATMARLTGEGAAPR